MTFNSISEIMKYDRSLVGVTDYCMQKLFRNTWKVHTSWQKFHDKVEVHLILETVEHFDHPQAVSLHQDVPLSTDMTNLTKGPGTHTWG